MVGNVNMLSEFRISCDDDEERASRRVYRGCTRSPTCKGCTSCVCFGCEICRFSDCSCQTCVDFTMNAKTWVSKVTLLSWWFYPLCGFSAHYWCCIQAPPPHIWKKSFHCHCLLYFEHEFPVPGFISTCCSHWLVQNLKFSNLFPSFISLLCAIFVFYLHYWIHLPSFSPKELYC